MAFNFFFLVKRAKDRRCLNNNIKKKNFVISMYAVLPNSAVIKNFFIKKFCCKVLFWYINPS